MPCSHGLASRIQTWQYGHIAIKAGSVKCRAGKLERLAQPTLGEMKILPTLSTLLFGTVLASAQGTGSAPDLRVLYVADGTSATRAEAFVNFLSERFGAVATANHETLGRKAVEAADVVILDWSMGKGAMPPSASPLGKRGDRTRPTVFLGTAGLHHSCTWEVAGGSG